MHSEFILLPHVMDRYNLMWAPEIRRKPGESELNKYYINTLKPQTITAFQKDPTLEWVSFTLLESQDPPVLHIGAVDSTDPRWDSFTTVIEPAVRICPKKVAVRIIHEVLSTFTLCLANTARSSYCRYSKSLGPNPNV